MKRTWQLQDAKNRLSEVVEEAIVHGPQTITRRGEPTAVVVSFEEFQRLSTPRERLVAFFRRSPLRGLDLTRSDDLGRDVDL